MYDYYEFEVSLLGIEPKIWRSVLIQKSATFYDLHLAIQDACGWGNYHLFAFSNQPHSPTIAGIPNKEDLFEDQELDPDAKKVKLTQFFKNHKKCLYEYDFGDSWMHEVKLCKTMTLPYKFKRSLIDGQRAFPREDSGGIHGYEACVNVIKTGEDPDEIREWLGNWNPDKFDFKAVKKKFDK